MGGWYQSLCVIPQLAPRRCAGELVRMYYFIAHWLVWIHLRFFPQPAPRTCAGEVLACATSVRTQSVRSHPKLFHWRVSFGVAGLIFLQSLGASPHSRSKTK